MPEITKEIQRLYFEEKLSYRQVANQLGLSNSYVSQKLKLLGGGRSIKEATALRSTSEYSEAIRRTKLGEKNTQSKLTETEVLAIREVYPELLGTFNKHQAQHLLADEYSVKRSTISDVVLRRTWKHI